MSKKAIPIVATGLPSAKSPYVQHDVTRRTILTGIPAAAIGGGALTIPMIAGQPDEISQLLEIERRIAAADKLLDAQYEINTGCARALNKARVGYRPIGPAYGDDPKSIYRNVRSKARFAATRERMKEDVGLLASEKRLKELKEEKEDIALSLWNIKATSIEALKIKARISEIHPYAMNSIVRDLLALNI